MRGTVPNAEGLVDLLGDDTSTPARITSIRWPLLLVLASLAAVAPVATDLYLPGFPEIAADLQVTPKRGPADA